MVSSQAGPYSVLLGNLQSLMHQFFTKSQKLKWETIIKQLILRSTSHELKTPANSIVYFSEDLYNDPDLCPASKEKLRIVYYSSKYLVHVINDILDFCQIAQGTISINYEWIELEPFIKNTVQILEFKARQSGITTQMNLADNIPTYIYSDRIRLASVILNLYSNAIKYSPRKSIQLEVQLKDVNSIILSISDTGSGILDSTLQIIQNEFEQSTQLGYLNLNSEMRGLGLQITKRIVDLLGGSIKVASQYELGSTFQVTMQIIPQDRNKSECELSPEMLLIINKPYSTQKINSDIIFGSLKSKSGFIMTYIDALILNSTPQSDLESQLFTEKFIKKLYNGKIQYDLVQNWHKLLDSLLIKQRRGVFYRLIILDCESSITNAFKITSTIQQLHQSGELHHMPNIIGCISENTTLNIEACIFAGMSEVIKKPIKWDKFIEVLAKARKLPMSRSMNTDL